MMPLCRHPDSGPLQSPGLWIFLSLTKANRNTTVGTYLSGIVVDCEVDGLCIWTTWVSEICTLFFRTNHVLHLRVSSWPGSSTIFASSFLFLLSATNGIFCVLIQEKGCRVANWFRLWKEWGGQGNRAKTWHYIFNFLSTASFMFYGCVLRLNGCHNDKRVQLMNPNVCHWSQRTFELLKDGTALVDLGQAFCLGWLLVLQFLIHCTVKSICPIGYFVLLLLLIKNRNQGWRTQQRK